MTALNCKSRSATLTAGLAIFLAVFLSACSSTPDKPMPTALVDFKEQIKVSKAWSAQLSPVASPLSAQIANGQLAIAASNGLVALLNAETGAEIWRLALSTPLAAGVGSDGNRLAVITQSNELVTLSQGKVLWKSKLPALSFTSPFVAGERVFVLTADRTVIAFDGATGRKIWSQQRTGDALVLKQAGILTSFQDNLVVGLSGRLVAMNPSNGVTKWDVAIGSSRGTNEVERLVDLVSGVSRVNNVICARAFQTSVTCVDALKGSNLWTRGSQGHVGLGGTEAALFGAESDGKLMAWNRAGGQVIWQNETLRFRGLTAPVAADGQLLVGDELGWLHWIDVINGQTLSRIQIDASGIAMPAMRYGKTWVVVAKSGLIQALRAD
jgi:outer membrane assembly lipoprotein YfgL